jgi:oxygen-independent coproporphyrinogen-3 oxidase
MNCIPAHELPIWKELDLEAIKAVVGPAHHVQYNKPHVYPMAAPMFAKRPGIRRPTPRDGPLELYIHIPFCNYKCNFCTYATRQGARQEQIENYIRALTTELQGLETGTPVSELYVGGGTPTVLAHNLLDEVLAAVWRRLRTDRATVHTVECSPESITPEHVRVLQGQHIERVSMGVQCLDDRVLERMHRRHTRQEALTACDLIVGSGRMLNVDLIYGLPGQTAESFANDFNTVVSGGAHSVTVYNLRLNEGTPIAGMLDDEEGLGLENLIKWRAWIQAIATEAGFAQTRWHTFSRPAPMIAADHPAARFENQPSLGDQFGVGMSARSRLGATVYRNHVDFNIYRQRIEAGESPVEEGFDLTDADRKALFVGQYLGNGRSLVRSEYERSFGRSFEDDFGGVLKQLSECDLVAESNGTVSLTQAGRLVFDLVNWMFYPQDARIWIEDRQNVKLPSRKGHVQHK